MSIDIPFQRLFNQCISYSSFTQPEEIVRWMGAVQAQDFTAAKWALGLRAPGLTDAAIEQAFDSGVILRTHVLRPTWHFVAPADIRWMLSLTSPRVNAYNATYYRKFGLDDSIFHQSNTVLVQTLQGGQAQTRPELESALNGAGIRTDDLRTTLLVMRAELDGVLCSGPRRGKQFTYMLLEERVPPAPEMTREESLAGLTLRYFASHGPAMLADFIWWSGLSASDARRGLEMVKSQLTSETLTGQTYWFTESTQTGENNPLRVDLLPNFDEYAVAYVERSAIAIHVDLTSLDPRSEGLLNYIMLVNGQFAGHWKRTIKKNEVAVALQPFVPLSESLHLAASDAVHAYGAFLGVAARLV